MGFSSLISEIVLASAKNYTKGRNGYNICKITPHHMAGKLTGKRCAELFQNASRGASANYCIGYDGEIVGCVDESNRAWTSANRTNDCQAITVEVSNSEIGGEWKISEASLKALIELCVDICKRYNFKLTYDETPNGSLTRHNMFANTNCPGAYLQSKFPEIVKIVNSRLEELSQQATPKKTIDELAHETIDGKWGNGIDRKTALTNAGYDYIAVQKRVNEILSGNVKPKVKTAIVTATAGLNIRAGIGLGYKIIATIPYNKQVSILVDDAGVANGYTWDKVQYGNIIGFVADKHLK